MDTYADIGGCGHARPARRHDLKIVQNGLCGPTRNVSPVARSAGVDGIEVDKHYRAVFMYD